MEKMKENASGRKRGFKRFEFGRLRTDVLNLSRIHRLLLTAYSVSVKKDRVYATNSRTITQVKEGASVFSKTHCYGIDGLFLTYQCIFGYLDF